MSIEIVETGFHFHFRTLKSLAAAAIKLIEMPTSTLALGNKAFDFSLWHAARGFVEIFAKRLQRENSHGKRYPDNGLEGSAKE